MPGIEPEPEAWEATILPLNYIRYVREVPNYMFYYLPKL
jgi:hypothetical protein